MIALDNNNNYNKAITGTRVFVGEFHTAVCHVPLSIIKVWREAHIKIFSFSKKCGNYWLGDYFYLKTSVDVISVMAVLKSFEWFCAETFYKFENIL